MHVLALENMKGLHTVHCNQSAGEVRLEGQMEHSMGVFNTVAYSIHVL